MAFGKSLRMGQFILVPDPNHNYSYPVIDNGGDIVYLKDSSGGGVGLVVALNQSGMESQVEFSSGNPPGCQPPNCTSWRSAGQHFGISRVDGAIISYHDFCSPSCTRTFDVSSFGKLSSTFNGDDFPDTNIQGVFSYSSANSILTALRSFSGCPYQKVHSR
jgi:hypothetical protein